MRSSRKVIPGSDKNEFWLIEEIALTVDLNQGMENSLVAF